LDGGWEGGMDSVLLEVGTTEAEGAGDLLGAGDTVGGSEAVGGMVGGSDVDGAGLKVELAVVGT